MQSRILEHYRRPLPRCPALEPLCRFNNYVKACLIQRYMRPGAQVLDMACGSGGDLKKYRQNGAGSYMGYDLVPERIEEATTRHRNTRCMFAAVFEVRDFAQALDLRSTYDFVSCQFALHYAWDTEERAMRVLRNAVDCMAEGAHFILTFPDYAEIVKQLFRMMVEPNKDNWVRWEVDRHVYRVGGPRHSLVFESPLPFLDFLRELEAKPFGRCYTYSQEGAVDQVPEYMVEPTRLHAMCGAVGLEVVFDGNFSRFNDPCPLGDGQSFAELRRRMGAEEPLDDEAKLIAALYRALVLRKPRAEPATLDPRGERGSSSREEERRQKRQRGDS